MNIYALLGLSACGKTEISNFLQGKDISLPIKEDIKNRIKGKELTVFTTSTSRPIRKGEIDKVHYYFFDKNEFKKKIDNGEFIEFAQVYNNYYGLLKSEVEKKLQGNQDICVVMDPQGVETLKQHFGDKITTIFIDVSYENMKKRMKINREEEEEVIKNRLKDLEYFFEYRKKCDYVLDGNSDINIVLNNMLNIIDSKE